MGTATNTPAFSDRHLYAADARARYMLTDAILHYLREGLRDIDGRRHVDIPCLAALVRGRFTEDLVHESACAGLTPDAAAARAWTAFEQSFSTIATGNGFACARPPRLRKWNEQGPQAPEILATTSSALAVARHNKAAAQARIVLLYLMAGLTEGAEAEIQAAEHQLFQQLHRFEKDELMFTVMLGGSQLDAMRAQLLRDKLTSGHSLIQYLTPGGGVPSRWAAGVDEAFLADLTACAKVPA